MALPKAMPDFRVSPHAEQVREREREREGGGVHDKTRGAGCCGIGHQPPEPIPSLCHTVDRILMPCEDHRATASHAPQPDRFIPGPRGNPSVRELDLHKGRVKRAAAEPLMWV